MLATSMTVVIFKHEHDSFKLHFCWQKKEQKCMQYKPYFYNFLRKTSQKIYRGFSILTIFFYSRRFGKDVWVKKQIRNHLGVDQKRPQKLCYWKTDNSGKCWQIWNCFELFIDLFIDHHSSGGFFACYPLAFATIWIYIDALE